MTEQFIFKKEQRHDYTVICNDAFDTEALSLTAIGLVCLLMSKPPTWTVKIEYLAGVCKEGEKAIRSALKEMAIAGYMTRQRQRAEDGTVRTVTLVADYPRYINEGTVEQRINGYEGLTDLPPTEGSVKPRVGETEGSVHRGVSRGEVLVSTDVVSTDVVSSYVVDDKANAFGAVVKCYEENIGIITAHIGEELGALVDEVGPTFVIRGIHIAVEQNKRSLSYARSCARNLANGTEPPIKHRQGRGRDTPRVAERRNYRPSEYADIILG